MQGKNVKVNNLEKIRIVHSDGFNNIHDVDFTLIMSNPPYHTDFSVAKSFIEGSYKHLQMGGWLVMVTKRFDWYKNKIQSVFGGVKWIESSGYYVFMAQKRFVQKKRKKTPLHDTKFNSQSTGYCPLALVHWLLSIDRRIVYIRDADCPTKS